MKTCFLSVLHPGAVRFFPDFLASLRAQENCEFELILGLDGCGAPETTGLPFAVSTLDCTGMSIAENRFFILNTARQRGFTVAVLGDSDDTVPAERVQIAKQELDGATDTILVNDLSILSESGEIIEEHYLRKRWGLARNPPDLTFCNYIGFSNAAVTLGSLDLPPLPSACLRAIDWYLFFFLQAKGWSIRLNLAVATCYRQHDKNTVGLGGAGPGNAETIRQRSLLYESLAAFYPDGLDRLLAANLAASRNPPVMTYPLWWENPPIHREDL